MGRVEQKIQADIIAYINGLDAAYVYNTPGSASSAKGTSDLLVCYRGRFVAFEVKRPDSSYGLTKPQRIRMRQIEKAGGRAFAVKSIADVAAALASVREEGFPQCKQSRRESR